MEGDRLTRKIYDWSKSLADKGNKNWAKQAYFRFAPFSE
jgi:hypothetical protein